MSKNTTKTVVVALSGGVDSSVAAALLKNQGYNVIGVFIKMWSDPDIPCTLKEERQDAMRVASKLDIPFKTWDLTECYKESVVEYMIRLYARGHTPNPDVMCNKKIKFGLFLKMAKDFGADFIATGHYTRVFRKRNTYHLLTGKDKNKDQSYFLWTLTQNQLQYVLFPVGDYTKPNVRKIAKKFKLPTAEKKDSQGICFMGKIDLYNFLKKHIPPKSGRVITTKKEIIGKHRGLEFYTIGQRHGIGIGGGTPYYVVKKDFKTNTLIVGKGDTVKELFRKEIIVKNLNWITGIEPKFPIKCFARIRYRQTLEQCRLTKIKFGQILATFNNPQKAVALGQSIVFYRGNEMLGGGIIS